MSSTTNATASGMMTQGKHQPLLPENPAPGTERDEEMRSENGMPSETEEENWAAKRVQINRNDYTMSKCGLLYCDCSPLRKLPI